MPTGKSIKFPQKAFNEAYALEQSDFLLEGRELIEGITIDSRESKDLDDGINLYKKDENYIIQVSITDVASFVTPDTALFKESLSRAATRYLTYGNVPMLPRVLSENKLSMLPGEPRPAITYDIEIDSDCSLKNLDIRETVFKNRRRMSYPEFDDIIQNKKDDPDYNLFLECANLANILMDNRRQRGALAIYDLKRMIYTTEEGIVMPLRKEFAHISNIVIQEFMILANKAIAHFHAENEIPLLYRNHTVRQNTPSREEIMSQLETVVQNPQYITSLQGRASLWFNRATYDPVLKGHFGLNEAAYTHVTSPIRRVPDLINQLYIKAYLKGVAYPFLSEQLDEISRQINERMFEIKDEKSKIYIQKEQWQARLNLNYESTEKLVEMDINDFKKVLKEAIVHNLLLDNLEAALLKRMDEKKLEAVHVFMLLFETKVDSPIWFDIKIRAIEYLYNSAGMPVSLLHLMAQNDMFFEHKIDISESKGGYIARVVAKIDDKEMTTKNFGTGNNKKEAQNKASFNFITAYINDNLISKDEAIIDNQLIPQSVQELVPVVPEENYVGILLELCNRYKDWKMPEYNYTMSGPSHQPYISCECTLQTPLLTLKALANGNSKKITKQIVSKKLLEQIDENKEILIENAVSGTVETLPDENYIGLVNDLCQKHNIKPPNYEFQQSGNASAPVFTCIVTLHQPLKVVSGSLGEIELEAINEAKENENDSTRDVNQSVPDTEAIPQFKTESESVRIFIGIGTTKKAAKQDAAFKCYTYLRELVGRMTSG